MPACAEAISPTPAPLYTALGKPSAYSDGPGTRSDAYLHLLPLLTQQRIELPPEPTLRIELMGLQRRTRSGGQDTVDHRPGAHDDVSNSVALAAGAAYREGAPPITADSLFVVPGEGFHGMNIGSGHRSDLKPLKHQLAMEGKITI